MSKEDGGLVAPRMKLMSAYGQLSGAGGSEFVPIGGLTLRDYFAAKMLQAAMTGAVLPGLAEELVPKGTESALRKVSIAAYRVADAMLAAR